MKALVKTAPGPGLELRDVPEPPMTINDVRIRVRKTGICGTDLHIADWDPWAQKTIKPPLIVGNRQGIDRLRRIPDASQPIECLRGGHVRAKARHLR